MPDRPDHPLLALSAIRALERDALAATPAGLLMERAATAVADACVPLLRRLPPRTPVLALAGPGNNGGDALLAALLLAARGWTVVGLALSLDEPAAADAARVWRRWHATGRPLAGPDDLDRLLAARPLVIDGLFGIGLTRPLPEVAAAIVRRLQTSGSPVVAVDVPSGLDADTGGIVGPPGSAALRADLTVTMIADKPGLHTGAGCVLAGRVLVADLGVATAAGGPVDAIGAGADRTQPPPVPPASTTGKRRPSGPLIGRRAAIGWVSPRARDAHKGRFGDLLVVAGAAAMRGAALLAALGGQAVGTGRITIGSTDRDDLAARPPELMTRHLRPGVDAPETALGKATAIVAGCGLGSDPETGPLLVRVFAHPAALVLDADGLNLVANDPRLRALLAARAPRGLVSVITPHPLEAARLLGSDTPAVQRDRIGAACELAAALSVCVVLKGAGTVVAQPDGIWSINASGGPILSVAGTGDVLAGVVGGLLAGGLAAPEAAAFGAWLHGAAGDALSAHPDWAGAVGLPASHLPDAIRATINRVADARFAA
jgi:hydroxyethylthiazole kinase-like uncharacterized protein yjeF